MDGRPDCTRCDHFVVTWRQGAPRACLLYGFEGQPMPSIVVERTTGHPCQGFQPKELPKKRSQTASISGKNRRH